MDFLKAVDIIGRDLEEALTLLEQLGVSGSDKAEMELARSRVRSAADMVRLLPSLSVAVEKKADDSFRRKDEPVIARPAEGKTAPARHVNAESAIPESVKQEPVKPEHVKQESVKQESVAPEPDKQEPVRQESVKTEHMKHKQMSAETVSVDPFAPGSRETAANEDTQPEMVTGAQPATVQKSQEQPKAILADRFTSGGTLGEKIQTEKKEEVISTVGHSKPISDIAAAIGINDRFYFIRELFSGDTLAYADTIKRLNAASSLGEAMRILDESTVMGSDPAAQSSFVDVVRRKFSLHV